MIRNFFIQSTRIHLRKDPARSPEELIGLIDRFLDGPLRYDLEWDDFISWENDNPHVEQIRNRIGEYERFLFSTNKEDRKIYKKKVIEERDRLAALLGLPLRNHAPN